MSLRIYLLCLVRDCHPYPGRIHWLRLKLYIQSQPRREWNNFKFGTWSLSQGLCWMSAGNYPHLLLLCPWIEGRWCWVFVCLFFLSIIYWLRYQARPPWFCEAPVQVWPGHSSALSGAPCREKEGWVVLQVLLLEFCYQTSHPAPAPSRGQLSPVNKVTILARTLQPRLLPSLWHEQATLRSSNRPQVKWQVGKGRYGIPQAASFLPLWPGS